MSSICAVSGSSFLSSAAMVSQAAASVSQASEAVSAASASLGRDGGASVSGAMVQQAAAVYAFKAGVKAMQVQSELIGSLVDVHA